MSQFTCGMIDYVSIHRNQQMHQLYVSCKLVIDATNISVCSAQALPDSCGVGIIGTIGFETQRWELESYYCY